jgi:hypothetical protein
MEKQSIMRWLMGYVICSSLLVSIPVRSQPNELLTPLPAVATVDDIVSQVRGLFERRWRNDPNFDMDLEYQIEFYADGRIKKIQGLDDNSRLYLERTNFLQAGEKTVSASDQDHVLWLVLGARGVVRVSLAPPPTININIFGGGSGLFKPLPPQPNVPEIKIREYFQKFWSAQNQISRPIQYRLIISRNGRLKSILGIDEFSRKYLEKTRFITAGEKVISPQRSLTTIWIAFYPNGDVIVLTDS